MNKKRLFHIVLIMVLATLFAGCFGQQTPPHKAITYSATTTPHFAATSLFSGHFSGGFGINTPAQVAKAASDGIQVDFVYNYAALPGSPLEQALKSYHMRVADGFIASQLYRYQRYSLCATRHLSCSAVYANETEAATYATIRAHLQKVVKDGSLVQGYWVLDDQIDTSLYGTLKSVLQNIHQLIQQYTPGLPAICGFGAGLRTNPAGAWRPALASDFSPQGCDMVGLYAYASASAKPPAPPATSYDWTMSKLLPAMFSSLQQQGWNITKTPLIGIGQAWGSQAKDGDYTTLTPQTIAVQSSSFCQHGATGLVFYGWSDSIFVATTQTPLNGPVVEAGIRQGVAACKQYWGNHP